MMDLPVMKFLAESVRNTAEVLLKTMQDGKSFVCDECFGNNFVPCEEGNINAIQMTAGGNTSWWHCGYCSLKFKNEGLGNAITNTTKPLTTGIKCTQCNEGELTQKRTRFGKAFYSCTKYPNCKYAIWDKPIAKPCPKCNHPFIVEHYTKKEGASLRCVNKECTFEEKQENVENAPAS
jgi:ssDNA-binding Zn-finger/Zn-ribbon topoisomerase 1